MPTKEGRLGRGTSTADAFISVFNVTFCKVYLVRLFCHIASICLSFSHSYDHSLVPRGTYLESRQACFSFKD